MIDKLLHFTYGGKISYMCRSNNISVLFRCYLNKITINNLFFTTIKVGFIILRLSPLGYIGSFFRISYLSYALRMMFFLIQGFVL